MTRDTPKASKRKGKMEQDAAKKDRLAKSLRQNLAKRKYQAKKRNISKIENT